MKRRSFLQGLAATAMVPNMLADAKIPKRVYKGDVKLSLIGFGGIVVVGMEQSEAHRTVAEAFERGVNYFDVAPSYFDGEAEETGAGAAALSAAVVPGMQDHGPRCRRGP